MVRFRRGTAVLLVAGLFLGGIFFGAKVSRWFRLRSDRAYDTPILIQQIQTLSDLVTVQYVLERVIILDVPPESTLGKFVQGDNRVLLLAHGVVKAGLDLSRMKPEDVQVEGKRVAIKLPVARITDAYLDDSQTRVIERTTGFLRSFDKDLEQNVRQNAVDDIRRAARMGGILKDADERARAQIRTFFSTLGLEVEFEPRGT